MSEAGSALPPVRRVRWSKAYRLVPSRYPPVDLFERVADPGDWELLAEIEGLTNDRLRQEAGDISLVPVEERLAGPGSTPIMAAFTHVGHPSRFSDGSYGVYYASNLYEGALHEVLYHRAVFLRRTNEGKTQFDLRAYCGSLDARLHDVREGWKDVHDPDSYAASQSLGQKIRAAGSSGIVYSCVRFEPARNIAIFRPSVLKGPPGRAHVVQTAHVRVEWNGERMTRCIKFGEQHWVDF